MDQLKKRQNNEVFLHGPSGFPRAILLNKVQLFFCNYVEEITKGLGVTVQGKGACTPDTGT